MRTLLLGMGNPLLADDAVGCRLAADVARVLHHTARFDAVSDCSVGGLNLLEVVDGYDRLIAIDSIKTVGGQPGAWYRFTADSLAGTMHLSNVHDANFATALELGRRLGMRLPPPNECHIFAVEIADNLTFSEELTPQVSTAYPEVLHEVTREIRNLFGSECSSCPGPEPLPCPRGSLPGAPLSTPGVWERSFG
jgi:hydrogenase maturation protease